jgi:hypothetical protein
MITLIAIGITVIAAVLLVMLIGAIMIVAQARKLRLSSLANLEDVPPWELGQDVRRHPLFPEAGAAPTDEVLDRISEQDAEVYAARPDLFPPKKVYCEECGSLEEGKHKHLCGE